MRIGLTGGIGAGKSYVSRLLTAECGIPVYDCDREAKRLMTASPAIQQQLRALVGTEAYLPDGELNKPLMAAYLFTNEEHQKAVNAIVHPAVRADFKRWATEQEQAGAPAIAIESAILVEAGFTDLAEKIIVVEAPLSLRLQRVMQRDGATEQQVRARMARQLSDEERRQAADFIIENDGRDITGQLKNYTSTIIQQKHHA